MLAPALFAKIASAGLAAKAATVAGVAVVGLSTAGFTGALPTPAQNAFATVVDHATPFTAPKPEIDSGDQDSTSSSDGTDSSTDGTNSSTDGTNSSTDGTEGQPAVGGDGTSTTGTTTGESPATATPFGQQVSQLAHANQGANKAAKAAGQHPGIGKTVSQMARAKHSTATDDPQNGSTADQSGDGSTADQSGDGSTADQSGDGSTADQSGDGSTADQSGDGSGDQSGETDGAPAVTDGASGHGKSAGHGNH